MNPKVEYQIYLDLEDIVEEMGEYVDAAVVEGLHDKKTLEKLGFKKDILKYSDNRLNDTDFADMIADKYQSVVILTDYDEAGAKYNKKLSTELERRGVRVEKIFRKKIKEKLDDFGMRTIESIYALRRRLFS
jgi:5S rRNA maturation endonuclease (ribonuclease M5)